MQVQYIWQLRSATSVRGGSGTTRLDARLSWHRSLVRAQLQCDSTACCTGSAAAIPSNADIQSGHTLRGRASTPGADSLIVGAVLASLASILLGTAPALRPERVHDLEYAGRQQRNAEHDGARQGSSNCMAKDEQAGKHVNAGEK